MYMAAYSLSVIVGHLQKIKTQFTQIKNNASPSPLRPQAVNQVSLTEPPILEPPTLAIT